jgi:hypothetical protein
VNPKTVHKFVSKSQNQQAHEPNKKESYGWKVETNNPCHEPKKPMGKCQKSKLTIHEPK